jgi:hypothetical protein
MTMTPLSYTMTLLASNGGLPVRMGTLENLLVHAYGKFAL